MTAPADELRALHAQLAQFRRLCNNVPVAMAYYERFGNTCRYANQGYAEMFGFDEQSILGREVAEVIGDEAAQTIRPQVDRVLSEQVSARYERLIPGPGGDLRSIEVHLLPHVDGAGAAIGAFVLISDITRHRRAEAALRDSEERLAKFMHASAEGIVFHKAGIITDANPPLLALLGHTMEQLLGRSPLDFIAPDHHARVIEVMTSGQEISYDSMALHADGSRLPVEFIVRTMVYQGERLRMTIVRDMRDRAEAQARIQHLAHHDALTGLPNRLAFDARARELLAQARDRGEGLALMFVDLDRIKGVNDRLGHQAGDAVLCETARRLRAAVRAEDLVGRWGGDEFVALLPRSSRPSLATVCSTTSTSRTLRACVRRPA